MRSRINTVITFLLLITMVGGLEVLDSALVNSPVREMAPESENTSEEEVRFFNADQKISKQAHQQSISVDKPILLLPGSNVSQPVAPRKERYILHQALLI
jgi:hypothetical protein